MDTDEHWVWKKRAKAGLLRAIAVFTVSAHFQRHSIEWNKSQPSSFSHTTLDYADNISPLLFLALFPSLFPF